MFEKIALIKNPTSLLNKKNNISFEQEAYHWLGARYYTPTSKQQLADIIRQLASQSVHCIIIDGGDGTISSIMTKIYHYYPRDQKPSLVILPSGNTNLIAKDIGFGVRGVQALRRIKKIVECGHLEKSIQHRHALKIEWVDSNRPAVLGMFQGTAAFTRAISIAHGPAISTYFPHDWAVGVTICSAFMRLIFPAHRQIWLQGEKIKLGIEGKELVDQQCFLFLSTTLHSLSHGVWPFWGAEPDKDGVYYLNINAYPSRLMAACYAFLRGKIPAWLRNNPNYNSGSVKEMILKSRQNIVLDGEEMDTGESQTIRISLGPQFSFVRL